MFLYVHRAGEEHARGLGRWNVDNMCKSYLVGLDSKAMLAASGHAVHLNGYALPRGRVQPPGDLAKAIFPWVETELAAIEEVGNVSCGWACHPAAI